jgi:hypothetical protein
MSTIESNITGRKAGRERGGERWYTRRERAALLREKYGFPVSENMLNKHAHYGTGPEEELWGKFKLGTERTAVEWARRRFRNTRSRV